MTSLFHQLYPTSVYECKSAVSVQLNTETHKERAAVSQLMDGGLYGSLAVACMGGTCVEVLLVDTEAT